MEFYDSGCGSQYNQGLLSADLCFRLTLFNSILGPRHSDETVHNYYLAQRPAVADTRFHG